MQGPNYQTLSAQAGCAMTARKPDRYRAFQVVEDTGAILIWFSNSTIRLRYIDRRSSTKQFINLWWRLLSRVTGFFFVNDTLRNYPFGSELTDLLQPGAQPLVFHSQEMF